mgnify:CR=1 FL=1
MATIRLANITKKFGADSVAVNDMSLTIEDGSFTTLLGPSGCGKTTLLRMIAGLETPSSGTISIGATDVYSSDTGAFVPPGKRELGLVFQSYALWPHMTVLQNIAFGLQTRRLPRKSVQDKVEAIAKAMQIGDYLHRFPSELSGGQQQRVAIARVLVTEPKVILLDEPLSNLDAALRMDMRAELKRLHNEMASTIIYVTHDQIEALTMSTDIALINRGVLQQLAAPMDLYRYPINTFAADFIGSPRINLIKGKVEGSGGSLHVRAGDLTVPLDVALATKVGEDVSIGLRAEDFQVSASDGVGLSPVTVYSVLPTGPEWYLRVVSGGQQMTVRVEADLGLSPDDTVWIGPLEGRVKCFDSEGRLVTG